MAEEVHFLYPESQWALDRLQDDPAHLLFKSYGDQVPADEWNHPGTKQGIYMMGPNGEYLEGAHATSGSASRLIKRMKLALERWEALRKAKGYASLDVPPGDAVAPPEIDAAPLALRISLRDLPRGKGDTSGRRRNHKDLKGQPWMKFTEWAWNQNWLALEDPTQLVPAGDGPESVGDKALSRIVRWAMVDNVRGQNPAWKEADVKESVLTMRVTKRDRKSLHIVYEGQARLDDGYKRFAPQIVGRATWDRQALRFTSFRIVATGIRSGAASFNQRSEDKDPAPMGVALELHASRSAAAPGKDAK